MVNGGSVNVALLNKKYGHEETKCGSGCHLRMYLVIPHMRSANFINKYGDFETPSTSWERLKIKTLYFGRPIQHIKTIGHRNGTER